MREVKKPEDLLPLKEILESYGLVVYDWGVLEGEKKAHLRISLENIAPNVRVIASGLHGRSVGFEWDINI